MIFHKAGKYSGNETDLPHREHPDSAVPYKEPQDMKKLAIVGNIGAIVVMVIFAIPLAKLGLKYLPDHPIGLMIGAICSIITLLPHEMLHAICFKKDVYYYSNLSQGMLFVVGTEDFSKSRFIFMSMLPNLVFGFLPYIIFLFVPHMIGLGVMGTLCIGMGFGDYMNVFNTLTQVPRGGLVYLSGMHSYWYVP